MVKFSSTGIEVSNYDGTDLGVIERYEEGWVFEPAMDTYLDVEQMENILSKLKEMSGVVNE